MVDTPEERREKERAAHLEALANIIAPIHETTQGEVEITVETPQKGTILDAPNYPLTYNLTVEANVGSEMHGWTMQGKFEEAVCYLHGFQTALMMLAQMVDQPIITTGH